MGGLCQGALWRPEAVLAYLSRYTHRVAISNSRPIAFDETGITFRYKDYRRGSADRQQIMTLAVDEFIRRFLLHVLPRGFHRIRHYGLLAGSTRKANLALAREWMATRSACDEQFSIALSNGQSAIASDPSFMFSVMMFGWAMPPASR